MIPTVVLLIDQSGSMTEAFGYDGGFVVRQGSRLVSIDAHGKIRWQKDL